MKTYVPFVLVLLAIMVSPSTAQATTVTIPDDIIGVLGEVAMAPVEIDDATGLFGFDFIISYDTNLLDLTDADVRLGPVGAGFSLTPFVQDSIGQLNVSAFKTVPLTGGSGNLLELDFHVISYPGVSPLSITGTLNDNPPTFDPGSIITIPEPSTFVALLGGLLLVVTGSRRSPR